jgi:hypothetical protein
MRFFVFALIAGLALPFSAGCKLLCQIPFQYQDGLIWLKVELTGKKKPLHFLLDSGASVSVIDLQTVYTQKVDLGERQPVEGVGGQGFGYRVHDFQAMVAGIPLPKSVMAIDLGTVSNCSHRHVDGILGVDFFRDRVVQIDFRGGEIRLLDGCDPELAKCAVLPIKICNGAFCVPIRIAGNPEQWVRLDTGCDSALEWVVEGMKSAQTNGSSAGLLDSPVHYINTSARLGKYCFNDIPAGIRTKQLFPGEDGLLGNALLSKFCVTIDERKSRVIFQETR